MHLLIVTIFINAVKCNLMELTTKSAFIPLEVSSVNTYAHVSEFLVLVDRSVAWHKYMRRFLAFFSVAAHRPGSSPSTPFPCLFPLFLQCDGCLFLLLHGGLWLGCLDLPTMGAVFIRELAASSGSSWMFQAPNLHLSDAVVN